MKKYTSERMLNDQYPIKKIRQVRRSFHSNNQPNIHALLQQSRSVRSTLSKVIRGSKTRTCDYCARGKTTFILVYDVRMYPLTQEDDDR